MGIDILSYALGKASGGGGGGGSDALSVWQVGFFGKGEAATATSITVNIDGYNGKYALISVMHRDTITTPSGCTLLDKTTYTQSSFTQYVSLFKCQLSSDSVSIVFNQASSARICATAWVIGANYSLTKTATEEFEYYKNKLNISSTALTFLTFNAPVAQTLYTNKDVVAESNGAWLCQPYLHYLGGNSYGFTSQLRHFTGIISETATSKTSWIHQVLLEQNTFTGDGNAQVVVYTISKA